jgi:hypothetical protein
VGTEMNLDNQSEFSEQIRKIDDGTMEYSERGSSLQAKGQYQRDI